MILNAVMCVWNEEDIIESTIKHAFAQGCINVYIIDNASTDRTVEIALNAGAKLATTFKTDYFDEDKKVAHINATIEYVNSITYDERIWWLILDADEFPNFDCKLTILCMLKNIDSSIRAIHGFMHDHKPTHYPYYVSGYHPADFQPICTKSSCSKVQLLRYDKYQPHLFSIGGAHDFITHGCTIPVMKDSVQIHHFPYRNPEHTLVRSTKLVHRNSDGSSRIDWHDNFLRQVYKSKSIQSQYLSRHNSIKSLYLTSNDIILKHNSLIYDYNHIKRYYNIETEKKIESSIYDKSIHLAVYYYFLRQYDIALCRFKDAFDICNDGNLKLLLLLKIAECFAESDIDAANRIISDVIKHNNDEINSYINKEFCYIINKSTKFIAEKKDNVAYKVDLHNAVFPPSIAERYKEITMKIKFN